MTAIHERVARLRAGNDPTVIARLPSGWAVLGEQQVMVGYSLLLPDPVVPDLNALAGEARARFLADLARCGDALLAVTGAVRINYAILGNVEPALHAHVFPRRDEEPLALRRMHPWAFDWAAAPPYSVQAHGALRAALATALRELRA